MIERFIQILRAQADNPRNTFRFIEGVMMIAISWFAVQLISASLFPDDRARSEAIADLEQVDSVAAAAPADTQPDISCYLNKLSYADMFGKHGQSDRPEETLNVRKSADRLLARFEIKGIIQGRSPKVILYDKAESRTTTLAVGESISDMNLIAIEDGHITFEFLGEEYEINY